MIQFIARKCSFDSAHRVMNEKMKCYNLHGHTYLCEVEFEFDQIQSIGYAIDFKEIKRIGLQWIDDMLDHGSILNPRDAAVIECATITKSKLWQMSLNGAGHYCNPSVENIAKEIWLAMETLFEDYTSLKIHQITLYETPNCYTRCIDGSISVEESFNWRKANYQNIRKYAEEKGTYEYDDRKA